MRTKDIIVVRAFMYDRKAQPVGTKLTVPFFFASEVVSANKAVYAPEPEPIKPEPEKIEPARQEPEVASEPVKGPIKTKKEDK